MLEFWQSGRDRGPARQVAREPRDAVYRLRPRRRDVWPAMQGLRRKFCHQEQPRGPRRVRTQPGSAGDARRAALPGPVLYELLQDRRFVPRPEMATKIADILVPDPIFGSLSGLFLAAPRRTGKSTFLRRDLAPCFGSGARLSSMWNSGRTAPWTRPG